MCLWGKLNSNKKSVQDHKLIFQCNFCEECQAMVPIRSWQQTRSGSSFSKSLSDSMVLEKLNSLNP